MQSNAYLKSLLLKAGLSDTESLFYIFALENKGCSISDIYKKSELSKSSAYRAFESLKNLELLATDQNNWKTNLSPLSLSGLIKKLENKQKSQKRVITELKTLNKAKSITGNSRIAGIETFSDNDVYGKYVELSELKFDTVLSYGSWEDFNNPKSLVSVERNFINNRLKNGGNAFICLTKTGPNTKEITNDDAKHNRTSKLKESQYVKPLLISAFEGNNLVYIWEFDEKGKPFGTLVDSTSISNFYKNFIYQQTL